MDVNRRCRTRTSGLAGRDQVRGGKARVGASSSLSCSADLCLMLEVLNWRRWQPGLQAHQALDVTAADQAMALGVLVNADIHRKRIAWMTLLAAAGENSRIVRFPQWPIIDIRRSATSLPSWFALASIRPCWNLKWHALSWILEVH